MATTFEVYCAHHDRGYARQAAHAAFALVDRLEQELSRFLANSDVSRLNELTAGQSTRVSPTTMECLEIARHLYELTGGAFDVSIGSGLDRLVLLPDDFTVHVEAEGVRLDLGGIGKGYAVDRMAELLEEDWGIDHALVHGGFSSVLALEPPPDRDGWALTLSAPWPGDERLLARLSARRVAFSASGTKKGAHIVDPNTGRAVQKRAVWTAVPMSARPESPSRTLQSQPSSVVPQPSSVAPQPSPAAGAEGFSTAFMILANPDVENLCRQCPGLEAWIAESPEGDGARTTLFHVPEPDRPPMKPMVPIPEPNDPRP